MTDKELRKLKRGELLEILLEQSKEIEELKKKLDIAERKLRSRTIKMKRAGSIAEAALQLNHVFEAAQAAADQYVLSVERLMESDDYYDYYD